MFNDNKTKDEQYSSSPFKTKKGKRCSGLKFENLERESVTSLYISWHLDRRFASGQEVKLLYAARAMRGHQFGGVPTTPKGRDLFLLGLFFG